MIRPSPPAPQTNGASPHAPNVCPAFDYTPLTTEAAQRVQTAAQHIRLLVQRTLEDVLAVGRELLAVKETLPHGQFGVWLRAEFDWTERTARRFMAVAERFGSKTDTMSVLRIDLTAAYLLTAPSAPPGASEIALELAHNGESITVSVAKGILGALENKLARRVSQSSALPESKLLGQLLDALESFRQRWKPRPYSVLARQLREFAESLEEE